MKGLLTELGMNTFTLVALVISFAAFVGILIWVTTRSQSEMDAQARLYEDFSDSDSDSDAAAARPLHDDVSLDDSRPGHRGEPQNEPRNA